MVKKKKKRSKNEAEFSDAIRRRDLQRVVWMIDSGRAGVDDETPEGETPVLAAIASNNAVALDLLLNRGAQVNRFSCHGYTPLMKAAAAKSEASVLTLLRHGADLFVKDPHNKIALDWARLANHEGVVQQLELAIHQHNCTRRIDQAKDETQRRNADLLERNAQLCASMADALSRGNDEIRQLIRVNDDLTIDLFTQARGESSSPFFLDYETKLGWTALTKAAAHGDFPIVELLVRHGADVNLETRLRHTPLTWAAYSGHKEIVQCLLQCGADVLKKTREGKTALIHACRNNQTVIVSILISNYHQVCIGPTTKKDYVDEKTPEWHNVFLDALLSTDVENKCALAHAEEQGHDTVSALLQQAIDRAKEHHDHVEHLKAKTMTVACSLGCGFEHAKDLMKYHEETQCPHRSIECEECKTTLRSMDLDLHKRRDCPRRQVTCINLQYGCSVSLSLNDMQVHETEHCHHRDAFCRLDCGKRLRWNARDAHEAHDCPLRPVECHQCCATLLGRDLRCHLRRHCVKRSVECQLYGGCGQYHPFDQTAFHREFLCVLRSQPCRWAHHGCPEILGPPEIRHAHESNTCDFREVTCRNGCNVTDLIYCFSDEHYAWDCPKQTKQCPLGCGESMEAQYAFGHQESNCGFCPRRPIRCNWDLCGKKITLFGRTDAAVQMRSDDVAVSETMPLTLEGVRQRISRLEAFISDGGLLSKVKPRESHPFLTKWLGRRIEQSKELLEKLHYEASTRGLVLRYDPTTQSHLISVDNTSMWMNLNHTYFAPDEDILDWDCGWMVAQVRELHENTSCVHKVVTCPLGCGQLCEQHQMASHTKDRCLKRVLACRLGCGLVMAVDLLLAHEDSQCTNSHVFCPHCHEKLVQKALPDHVRDVCIQFPRPCRLTCGTLVPLADVSDHESTFCPKRIIKCTDCHQPNFAKDMAAHQSFECAYRQVGPCELGCGTALCFNQIQLHISTQCLHRLVPCPQCQLNIRLVDFDSHAQFLCPERILFCHKGCGVRVCESDLTRHEAEDCLHRPTVCPLECRIICAASTLQRHMQAECPRRLLACPNRCNLRVAAVEMAFHLKNCDHRMVACGAGSQMCARPLKVWIKRDGTLDRCLEHHEHGFMWALKTSDVDSILVFLHRMSPSVLDEEFGTGFTPLTLVAAKGDAYLVRRLLQQGANVNLESSRGRTPLGEATLGQHFDIVAMLIEHRAVVGYTNRHGLTTMSIATQVRHEGILDLLSKRLRLETLQKELFLAIATSDYDTIESLVAGGDMAYRENHAWHLAEELKASQAALEDIRVPLVDQMEIVNVAIADSEAKQMRVVKLIDLVEYNTAQLDHVLKKEVKLQELREALEQKVKAMIRSITTKDIVLIVSQTDPSQSTQVVLKAIALFNGVIPRAKRSTQQGAFSDKEWWEATQAMLMDRQFLRKLMNLKELDIPPDVLFKVRRECLKNNSYPTVEAFLSTEELVDKPPLTPFLALATWVRGVEMHQKSKAEARSLSEKKAALEDELESLQTELDLATFHMKSAHRSLPSRQEELDRLIALETKAAADFNLKKRRVEVCELLAFTSLNGHTPLSFASAVGNERAVRILLSRGANASYSDPERHLAARVLQHAMRKYVQQNKLKGNDAMAASITNYLSLTTLFKALRRYRQSIRIALHEAAYNGHADMLPLLIDSGGAPSWQRSFVEPIAAFPGDMQWKPNNVPGMGVWILHFEDKPWSLKESFELGQSRLTRPAFRLRWDSTTFHDDTQVELERVLATSSKRQQLKRDEQLTRKKILRRAQHQNQLHLHFESAIASKDFIAAADLLDQGAFPDHATPDGLTILMQACSEEIYLTNSDGLTVLAVDYLLDRAVNRPSPNHESVSMVTKETFLPLHVAAHYGAVRCGRSLVSRGAEVNSRLTSNGSTALMAAVHSNKDDFVAFLLEQGANVFLKDNQGDTAMAYAARGHHEHPQRRLANAYAGGINDHTIEYGLCRWGCGFIELRDDPQIEDGRIARLKHPLQEHEANECPKRIMECPQHCGVIDLWAEEIAGHLAQDCPLRLLPCSNSKCTATIPAANLRRHETAECIHRTVVCTLCGESSLAHKLNIHMESLCRRRQVPCPLCSVCVVAMDLAHHMKFECPTRQVRCRLGCGFIECQNRQQHEAFECIKRSISCIFGCDNGTTPQDQAAHEEECELRWVPCPNKCKERLRAYAVDVHLTACEKRFIACSLGCGQKVRAIDESAHQNSVCTRRLVRCHQCDLEMTAGELDESHPKNCLARIIPCGACGSGGISAGDMPRHKAHECRMRVVECKFRPDGCLKAPLFAHEKTTHETMECRFRTIWCPLGCRLHLIAKELKAHEAICTMRFTICSLGCGTELREKDRLDHEQFDCLYHKK